MTRHDLKCWPEYFEAIHDGRKTFEVRKNDRGYQAGDILDLHEWDPKAHSLLQTQPGLGRFTGRTARFRVGYVLSHCGVAPLGDLVVMSLLPIEDNQDGDTRG